MSSLDYQERYRRNLPHIQPEGAALFVTFRLFDSIPANQIRQWRAEQLWHESLWQKMTDDIERQAAQREFHRQRFKELEIQLDDASYGPTWLKQSKIARIVYDSILYRDRLQYRLDAFCVMSNHAHVLFEPLLEENGQPFSLPKIMHSLKSWTATESNKALNRTGTFWQAESYDHYVRDQEEWIRILHYILRNPIKAGLVADWRDHPFTYCSEAALPFVTI